VSVDQIAFDVEITERVIFGQGLAFEIEPKGAASRTVRALCVDQIGTFKLLERSIRVLEDGSEHRAAISLPESNQFQVSLNRDTGSVECLPQNLFGVSLGNKQHIVVFA